RPTPEDPPARFVRLFARHEQALYRFALTLLADTSDAEDVVQEAATVLWQKFDQYDSNAPFLPWARRFVYFEALKAAKKRTRNAPAFEPVLMENLAEEYAQQEPVLSRQRRALDFCLNKLKRTDRSLLMQRYQADQTIRSLADQTGQKVNTLYKRLDRLRRKLLSCVEKQLQQDGVR
ncbi:MAG: sigma-70 family RNA polymerase sigma factor, partial [Phycisphaeraceae bacterium]|nr:sigma-70 family RNA polymerase sigma factor [Phycisphaeraceae bacterium]